jgi:hypothetical protein
MVVAASGVAWLAAVLLVTPPGGEDFSGALSLFAGPAGA